MAFIRVPWRFAMFSMSSIAVLATLGASQHSTRDVRVADVGTLRCNLLDSGVSQALGVPYAKAPVGPLRFSPPVPLPKRSADDLLDATHFGARCMQLTGNPAPPADSQPNEDCLQLNLWVPPGSPPPSGWPVFFWIHGGAFSSGSAVDYDGEALAKRGLLVVTVNYRLSVFGFMPSAEIAAESPGAPSNGAMNGLLDQALALRWVADHVSAFGGDAKRVTIAGESAGAESVEFQLHLPFMQGLFQRAIIESGFWDSGYQGYAPTFSMNETFQAANTKSLLASLNVSDLAGLRSLSAEKLMSSAFALSFSTPSVDGFYWPFAQDPHKGAVKSSVSEVIIGGNGGDSILMPPFDRLRPPEQDALYPSNASMYEALLVAFFGPEVLEHYPVPPSSASKEEIRRAYWGAMVDMGQHCGALRLATKLRAAGSQVYLYDFEYWPTNDSWRGLSPHAAELSYVFGATLPAWDLATPAAQEVVDYISGHHNEGLEHAIRDYWTSFVATGMPKGHVAWPPFTELFTAPSLFIDQHKNNSLRLSVSSGDRGVKCDYVNRFKEASQNNAFNLFKFIVRFAGTDNNPLPPTSVPAYENHPVVV